MKKTVLFLLLIFLYKPAFTQDTTKITYSEEPDTLVKQRFIDKYENVFMTKVPTRHMFKMSVNFYPIVSESFPESQKSTYGIGYEYKLFPAFSLGADFSINGGRVIYESASPDRFEGTVIGNIYSRWYYNMKRRIREGKNANNFSGNYLAIVAEKRWQYTPDVHQLKQIGIEFGIQRRFLNHGRLEFTIGAFYQKYPGGYSTNLNTIDKTGNFEISTKASLGLAFGDWKRTSKIPICDILYCDDFVNSQFKVLWPIFRISNSMSNGTLGISYERKFGKSPVSVHGRVLTNLRYLKEGNDTSPGNIYNYYHYYQFNPSLQIRYYFSQKRQIRRGSGGNNLSGIYFGPQTNYVVYNFTTGAYKETKEHLGPGFAFGYQKTLFRHAYIDFYGMQSWNMLKLQPNDSKSFALIRIDFGLAF